jgi:hypothetical protein
MGRLQRTHSTFFALQTSYIYECMRTSTFSLPPPSPALSEVPSVVQKAIQKNHPPSGGSVGISLNDKRADVYVPPFKPFGGTGTALGSSSSSSTPASAIFTPPSSSSSAAASSATAVDTTKETVTVQVKLVNGRRETVTLNATHTIADLQAKVAR